MPGGRRATTGSGDAPFVEEPQDSAALTLLASSFDVLRWQGDYWAWPLPAEGSMVIGCRWKDRAIDESLVSVDTAALRTAAAAAGPVWRT
jgi:hypothetical protein